MSWDIEARTSAAKLTQLEQSWQKCLAKMVQDVEALNRAYQNAEWNDTVSESTRLELNDYIYKLNQSLANLDGVIFAVAQMRQLAEKYESME